MNDFEENMENNLGLAYIKVIKEINKKKKIEEANIKTCIDSFNQAYEEHKNNISG